MRTAWFITESTRKTPKKGAASIVISERANENEANSRIRFTSGIEKMFCFIESQPTADEIATKSTTTPAAMNG